MGPSWRGACDMKTEQIKIGGNPADWSKPSGPRSTGPMGAGRAQRTGWPRRSFRPFNLNRLKFNHVSTGHVIILTVIASAGTLGASTALTPLSPFFLLSSLFSFNCPFPSSYHHHHTLPCPPNRKLSTSLASASALGPRTLLLSLKGTFLFTAIIPISSTTITSSLKCSAT